MGDLTAPKSQNLERVKARQKKLKSEHRCTSCGKQDERTLAGKIYCAECAKKKHNRDVRAREWDRAYRSRPDVRQRINETQRARRMRLKAEHRCTGCGALLQQEDAGHVTCSKCRTLKLRYAKDGKVSDWHKRATEDCPHFDDTEMCLRCTRDKCVFDED